MVLIDAILLGKNLSDVKKATKVFYQWKFTHQSCSTCRCEVDVLKDTNGDPTYVLKIYTKE